MNMAFVCAAAVSVALADTAPAVGILFLLCSLICTRIRALRYITPVAIPLLLCMCMLTLSVRVTAIMYICCVITATVKKNFYYCLPILLGITFVLSVFGMQGESPSSYAGWFLLPLALCVGGIRPENTVKALCASLAVILPITFGGARVQAVCLLLPAVIPVLLYNTKAYNLFRKE